MEFLHHLMALDGLNTSLHVFCRIDVSIFVSKDRKVSLFVNEVERGITTCLWNSPNSGSVAAGRVGTDMAWPLACWILEQKKILGIN